jgi:hypothetical protein
MGISHRLPNRYRCNGYANRYRSNSLINKMSVLTNNCNDTRIVTSGFTFGTPQDINRATFQLASWLGAVSQQVGTQQSGSTRLKYHFKTNMTEYIISINKVVHQLISHTNWWSRRDPGSHTNVRSKAMDITGFLKCIEELSRRVVTLRAESNRSVSRDRRSSSTDPSYST